MEDKEYYFALQNSLEGYDAKLWQVPGLFFIVIGLLLSGLDKYDFVTIFNGIVFCIAAVLTLLLLIYYNKAHLFFLLIQEKINEFDDLFNKQQGVIERIPLASMKPDNLTLRLAKLSIHGKLKISRTQYLLASFRASTAIKFVMFVTFLISLFLGLYIVVPMVYKLFTK
jgi:hypothetical protein